MGVRRGDQNIDNWARWRYLQRDGSNEVPNIVYVHWCRPEGLTPTAVTDLTPIEAIHVHSEDLAAWLTPLTQRLADFHAEIQRLLAT